MNLLAVDWATVAAVAGIVVTGFIAAIAVVGARIEKLLRASGHPTVADAEGALTIAAQDLQHGRSVLEAARDAAASPEGQALFERVLANLEPAAPKS